MNVIEIIYAVAFICIGAVSSVTDLKDGMVYNKHILIFCIIGGVLDAIYFGIYARELLIIYVINCLCIVVISVILYMTRSFAGGDCKLAIVLAMLYPAKYYVIYSGKSFTLFFAIGCALILGYIYLVISAMVGLIQKKNKITLVYLKSYFANFLSSFVRVLIYVSVLNYIFVMLIQNGISFNIWIIRMNCILLAIIIGKLEILKKGYILILAFIVNCVMGCFLKMLPFSFNAENYVLVIVLLILQMLTKTNLYKEVGIDDLKKGMILSSISSLMMQNSRIKGLPGISYENLKNRLSQEEIEGIRRWGKKKNIKSVLVVKKVPFALFMVLGFFMYYLTRNIFL